MEISITSPCNASTIIKYGIKNWPIWECEPSTFAWRYEEKEVCLIIEGEAIIKTLNGKIYEIVSGDLITFPSGLSCTWEVKKSIKKHFRLGN